MSDLIPGQKSWFSKPEGKVGTVVPVILGTAAVGGLVYTWGSILPWVITMLQNTLTAAALAVGVGACAVVVSDKRWRNLAFYAYKSFMRGLTGLFIEIDPIGILKTYVETLRQKLSEMDESIQNLAGQISKLKNQIDKNEASRIHSLELAQQARKKGDVMKSVLVLQSRQAGRLEKSNMTLQNLYDNMTRLMTTLRKMRETSGLLIEDIQGEVDVKSQERAAILAGYSALSRAKKIMQGGDDESAMFNMAMEKLTEDYGMKMGEIDNFMEVSKGVIDGVDLENGIYEESALQRLDDWEKKTQGLLISHEEAQQQSSDSFSDLFHKTPEKISK